MSDYYNDLCAECGHKRLHHRADIKESPDYAPCHVLQPEFCPCNGFRAQTAGHRSPNGENNG